MDQDIKEMQLDIARKIRMKSSEMEGLFRSLFQACTQHDLVTNIELYSMMHDQTGLLMYDVRSLIKQHAALVASPAEQGNSKDLEPAVN